MSSFWNFFEAKPEQSSAEDVAVPTEKSTDEQATEAPTKEAFVKPSEDWQTATENPKRVK